MPKYSVSKSVSINAPIEKVYTMVSDLSHWTTWSPWLIMEPEATVKVEDDNYTWEGKRVGSGKMEITDLEKNNYVNYDLTFLTPFKSYAKVRFDLKEIGDQTQVTWSMDSSLPFFLFWMKKMISAFLGMDFQRGLALLKDYAEDGDVHSKLTFKGLGTYPGCQYVGIKTTSSISSLGESMEKDFTALMDLLNDYSNLGTPISIYHKWEPVKDKVTYTSAIPIKESPDNLPSGFITGEIVETKTYTLSHKGPYHHLGNAWSTMMAMARSKEFKQNKKLDPFEIYINSPEDTTPSDLITEVVFPVK